MKKKFLAFLLTMVFIIMTVPAQLSFATVTDTNPYNVALGKSVTDVNSVGYSDYTKYDPANITDGDQMDDTSSEGTFAIKKAQVANAVLEINLGATYTLVGADVLMGKDWATNTAQILTSYQLEYLGTDSVWYPVAIKAGMQLKGNNSSTWGNKSITIDANGYTLTGIDSGFNYLLFKNQIKTNKIRLVSKTTSATVDITLKEIRVYKALEGDEANNVAYRKPVTLSYTGLNGDSGQAMTPSFVVDGQNNDTTNQIYLFPSAASISTNDHWVEIDLLDEYNIGKIDMKTAATLKSFKMQAYIDGAYTDIPNTTFTDNATTNVSLTFDAVTTSKIRLYVPAGNTSIKIAEIKAFAVDDLKVESLVYKDALENGSETDKLVENGAIYGNITLKNQTSQAKQATFVAALYDETNGVKSLSKVDFANKTIAAYTAETLAAGFTLPQNLDNSYLKIFVFENFTTLKPYFNADAFSNVYKDKIEVAVKDISDGQMLPDTATIEVDTAAYGSKTVEEVKLVIDGTEYACTENDGVYSLAVPASLADGEHTIYAKAVDNDNQETLTEEMSVTLYDASKLVVTKTTDAINFYVKGSNSDSNKYIKHVLKRVIKEADDADLWRMYESRVVIRTGEYTFDDVYSQAIIAPGAEWECAFKEVSSEGVEADDFVGGYHGREKVDADTITAKIDGTVIDFTEAQNFLADKIEFEETSNMYSELGEHGLVAIHKKAYTITNEKIEITQEIDWKADTTMNAAYLTMLPIYRQLNDGTQITDRVIRDDDGDGIFDDEEHDVSTKNNTLDIAKATNNIFAAKIWGQESGISAEVSVAYDPVIETNDFFVSMYTENNGYNKLYFDYSDDYTAKADDVWKATTTFKFDINK